MKCNYDRHHVSAKQMMALWCEYKTKRYEERRDARNWVELLDLIEYVDRFGSELDESPREK
jgi:hypothetical protein